MAAGDKAIPALNHNSRKADSSVANFSKKGEWRDVHRRTGVGGIDKSRFGVLISYFGGLSRAYFGCGTDVAHTLAASIRYLHAFAAS